MNTAYLDAAREHINSTPLLINVISRRVRQLNRGQRPMVKPDGVNMSTLDMALKEIAEGLLTAEMGFEPTLETDTENLITL